MAAGDVSVVVGVAGASAPAADEGNVGADQLVVRPADDTTSMVPGLPTPTRSPLPDQSGDGLAARDSDAATIAAAIRGARIAPLEVAMPAVGSRVITSQRAR